MESSVLGQITDRYSRQARLYPALLTGAPLLAVGIGVYGVPLEAKVGLITTLGCLGVVYLLMTISREMGKRKENRLFEEWGGKPTTQLLRHRDQAIDPISKNRYHQFLARNLHLQFPTVADELHDPGSAEDKYESGAKWLLDHTRDTKTFHLLFNENVEYGFRRNCLGLKPYAIGIDLAALAWLLGAAGFASMNGVTVTQLGQMTTAEYLAVAFIVVWLAIWLFFVTKRTVRSSAFMYAELLLRACDVLD
jgi:hypothetical protein